MGPAQCMFPVGERISFNSCGGGEGRRGGGVLRGPDSLFGSPNFLNSNKTCAHKYIPFSQLHNHQTPFSLSEIKGVGREGRRDRPTHAFFG